MQNIKDKQKRLREIEAQIKRLNDERKELLAGSSELISKLPSRARNELKIIGIETDYEFINFLEGNMPIIKGCSTSVHLLFYEKAKNPLERLMSFRGIGSKTAKQTMQIVEQNGQKIE